MYKRRQNLRALAAIPAAVLLVAISVIAGPTASAAYTTPVTANAPTTIDGNLGWGTAYSPPAGTLNGTSNDDEPLEPVNFVQGFALGVALVLIGWLLLLESRKSA